MKKVLYLIIFSIFINLFISCDISLADIRRQHGFDIYFDNYYDWCMKRNRDDFDLDLGNFKAYNKKTGMTYRNITDVDIFLLGSGEVYGLTEWIDWQSEEGKLLHSYIGNSKIKEDFQGKFQITTYLDKFIKIEFNDNNNTVMIFEMYYGDWKYDKDIRKWTYDKSLWEKEEKEDEFSYSCWLRELGIKDFNSFYINGCSDSNRARITIRKLEDTDMLNMFRYTLNIQGKDIIDCKMYNYKEYDCVDEKTYTENNILFFETKKCKETLYKYPWSPHIDLNHCLYSIYLTFPSNEEFYFEYKRLSTTHYIFKHPHYGISIKDIIDEEKKIISFNILDEDNCAFADYFTYIYNDDINKREVIYYKTIDGIPKVVKTIKGNIPTNGEKYPDLYK